MVGVLEPWVVIRRLIDDGPSEATNVPLPAPYDALWQAIMAVEGTFYSRAAAYIQALFHLPLPLDAYQVALNVYGANLTGEQPIDPQLDAHLWASLDERRKLLPKPNGKSDKASNFPSSQLSTPKREELKLYSASDAARPLPEIDWVLEGLFSAGSLNLMVGRPGAKKTWSALVMCVCAALGVEWAGFKTTAGPVLFIDEQSGFERFSRRLQAVMRAYDAPEDLPLFYTCLAGLNLRSLEDAEALENLMRETKARLVVIDALSDIMAGGDENAVRDVHPVFQALRGMADRTGAAIVILHHPNKGGGFRGSTAMQGDVELMLMVHSEDGSSYVSFTSNKTRDYAPLRFAAHLHFEPADAYPPEKAWMEAAKRQPSAAPALTPAQEYVVGWLRENGESGTKEIMENAEGCSPESARKAIFQLVDMGLVERVDEGVAGQKANYGLKLQEEDTR